MATPTIQSVRHTKNVGVFADVAAGAFPYTFKPFNLIYGFNGCGKTTLSRLLDSLGDRGINANLAEGAEFSFLLSDGSTPSNANLANAASRFLAVFNEDYVERTLTWKEGTAKPIIYLGQEQRELAKKLADLEAQEASTAQQEVLRNSEWSSAQRTLDTKCRDTARLIAEELNLGRQYNASHLKADYKNRVYTPSEKIDDEERKRLKEVINKSDLPKLISPLAALTGGDAIYRKVANALAARVQEIAIAALQRRKDALGWVEQGLELHSGEQECLFCGNMLLGSRIHELENALKVGFDSFSAELATAVHEAAEFRDKCRRHREALASSSETLPTYRTAWTVIKEELAKALDEAAQAAEYWIDALARKKASPDETPTLSELDVGWDASIGEKYNRANAVITRNNNAIDNFANEQKNARNKIKAHHLADHQSSYDNAVATESKTREVKDKITENLNDIRQKVAAVVEQLRTHGLAAAELNRLLKSYLGHAVITLQSVDEGYRICRHGKISQKPLSEGEKTAVAFCYFITSLTSEGRRIADLIVVLDDPISSLDTRAMTHVVSMIRRKFSSPTQIFILTHNLDFMREMKKWLGKKYEKDLAEFLFIETGIEKDGTRLSKIVKMPKLIREYESEYHYLYSLVKQLADNPQDSDAFCVPNAKCDTQSARHFLGVQGPGSIGIRAKGR